MEGARLRLPRQARQIEYERREMVGETTRKQRWTRLQPIRTAAEIAVEFVIFTAEPFQYQQIADEARRMRRLGMSFRAIGVALGVDGKTVRKAVAGVGDVPDR